MVAVQASQAEAGQAQGQRDQACGRGRSKAGGGVGATAGSQLLWARRGGGACREHPGLQRRQHGRPQAWAHTAAGPPPTPPTGHRQARLSQQADQATRPAPPACSPTDRGPPSDMLAASRQAAGPRKARHCAVLRTVTTGTPRAISASAEGPAIADTAMAAMGGRRDTWRVGRSDPGRRPQRERGCAAADACAGRLAASNQKQSGRLAMVSPPPHTHTLSVPAGAPARRAPGRGRASL